MMLAHTCVFLLAGTLLAAPAAAAPAGSAPPGDEPSAERPAEVEQNPIELLLGEIDRLFEELTHVRHELAQVKLASLQSKRELNVLRQFMRDRREYGQDFDRYTEVRAVAEKEARQRQVEANRQRREVEKAERRAGRQAARSQRAQQRAETQRVERYRKSGFSPLGLDVFAGKMAFYYESDDNNVPYRFDYQSGFGHYLRFYPRYGYYPAGTQLDYSEMTISGSVLNAADEVRHLGIAIAFFDENGNQVGGETIQINNARPDVPYPFTAKLDMALNRPFNSSSTYVLYADPAGETDRVPVAPPAPTNAPTKPDYSMQSPDEKLAPAGR